MLHRVGNETNHGNDKEKLPIKAMIIYRLGFRFWQSLACRTFTTGSLAFAALGTWICSIRPHLRFRGYRVLRKAYHKPFTQARRHILKSTANMGKPRHTIESHETLKALSRRKRSFAKGKELRVGRMGAS